MKLNKSVFNEAVEYLSEGLFDKPISTKEINEIAKELCEKYNIKVESYPCEEQVRFAIGKTLMCREQMKWNISAAVLGDDSGIFESVVEGSLYTDDKNIYLKPAIFGGQSNKYIGSHTDTIFLDREIYTIINRKEKKDIIRNKMENFFKTQKNEDKLIQSREHQLKVVGQLCSYNDSNSNVKNRRYTPYTIIVKTLWNNRFVKIMDDDTLDLLPENIKFYFSTLDGKFIYLTVKKSELKTIVDNLNKYLATKL